MKLAPIILFTYKRPQHLSETLHSLAQNPLARESHLIVFSDGAKSIEEQEAVEAVRAIVADIKGFGQVEIHTSPHNQGLANSVIQGVSQVLAQYRTAIMLEDDMICTPDFLRFMNEALVYYQNHPKVFSLSGYSFPLEIPKEYPHSVYALPRASSWGWATWQDRWQKADWEMKDFEVFKQDRTSQRRFNEGGADLTPMLFKQQKGLVDSWAIRWIYTHFKHEAYAVYPRVSHIRNIGVDGSGTHSPKTDKYKSKLQEDSEYTFTKDLRVDVTILAELQRFFKRSYIRTWIDYFSLGIKR